MVFFLYFFLSSICFIFFFFFFSLDFSPPHTYTYLHPLLSFFLLSTKFQNLPLTLSFFFSSLAAFRLELALKHNFFLFFSSSTLAGALSHIKIVRLSFSHHRISSSPPRAQMGRLCFFIFCCSNLISFKIVI